MSTKSKKTVSKKPTDDTNSKVKWQQDSRTGWWYKTVMHAATEKETPVLTRIVDAEEPLGLEVTPKVIKEAKTRDGDLCVIALALKNKHMMITRAFIGNTYARIYYDLSNTMVRYRLGAALRKAITEFDKTGEWSLPPGNYRLSPVPPQERQGARNRWTAKYGSPKKKGNGSTKFTARRLTPTRDIKLSTRGLSGERAA